MHLHLFNQPWEISGIFNRLAIQLKLKFISKTKQIVYIILHIKAWKRKNNHIAHQSISPYASIGTI